MDLLPGVQFGTRSTLEELTDSDLSSFYLHVTAGWPVADKPWYKTVESLFTQDGGTKIHPDTMLVIDAVVRERLG